MPRLRYTLYRSVILLLHFQSLNLIGIMVNSFAYHSLLFVNAAHSLNTIIFGFIGFKLDLQLFYFLFC